jgi:transposase
MTHPTYFLGIDIAAETVAASVFSQPGTSPLILPGVANTLEGFQAVEHWMVEHSITPHNCVLCLEATGVYGEALSYYFTSKGYRVAVEPPLKVKRAFRLGGHKTDPVDAAQIAEYAYRFYDELHFWTPPAPVLEQVKALLAVRDQFLAHRTANTNALRALERKPHQIPLAEVMFQQAIDDLTDHIKALEQEIQRLLNDDHTYRQLIAILTSICGIGMIFAANLLVLTQAFSRPVNHKQLASYFGVSPLQHTSGSSVYKKPCSRRFGPGTFRKLLYLASLSVSTHNPQFRQYYLRKVAEGKPKRLVLNNVGNKLLKVVCALVKERSPFIPNYRSIHPSFQ